MSSLAWPWPILDTQNVGGSDGHIANRTWIFQREAPFFTRALCVKLRSTVSKCFYTISIGPKTPILRFLMCHTSWFHPPWHTLSGDHWPMVGTQAHGDHWQCNFVYSSPILANSTPNCIYCLQEASSWDWLSCQTHRTCVSWKNTWLLRPLFKSEGVSTAVPCIADCGCRKDCLS